MAFILPYQIPTGKGERSNMTSWEKQSITRAYPSFLLPFFPWISFTFAWESNEMRISGQDRQRGNDEEGSSWKNKGRKVLFNFYYSTAQAEIRLVGKQYTRVSKGVSSKFTHIQTIYRYYRVYALDIHRRACCWLFVSRIMPGWLCCLLGVSGKYDVVAWNTGPMICQSGTGGSAT